MSDNETIYTVRHVAINAAQVIGGKRDGMPAVLLKFPTSDETVAEIAMDAIDAARFLQELNIVVDRCYDQCDTKTQRKIDRLEERYRRRSTDADGCD